VNLVCLDCQVQTVVLGSLARLDLQGTMDLQDPKDQLEIEDYLEELQERMLARKESLVCRGQTGSMAGGETKEPRETEG